MQFIVLLYKDRGTMHFYVSFACLHFYRTRLICLTLFWLHPSNYTINHVAIKIGLGSREWRLHSDIERPHPYCHRLVLYAKRIAFGFLFCRPFHQALEFYYLRLSTNFARTRPYHLRTSLSAFQNDGNCFRVWDYRK